MTFKNQGIKCRFCKSGLSQTFSDLGMSPLSNAFVKPDALGLMENFYPLHAYVCESCFLVQLQQFASPQEIFDDYAYFSSISQSWLRHCELYTQQMIKRFGLCDEHQVIEIASNDGYLLKYFKQSGVPVLGIEPADNVAKVAQEAGVNTLVKFFGVKTAQEIVSNGTQADLLLGNNVLAHVPDLNDFVEGMKIVLKPDGMITMEFPHLLRMIESNQFDTIYHEHFSYLSFQTVEKIFAHHGLVMFDVEELSTHGGSIRIYAQHFDTGKQLISDRVAAMEKQEADFGLGKIETYINFSEKVCQAKRGLLQFLIQAKQDGKCIVGYGAAAKGNTLLNYCGIRQDFLDYVVDNGPYKQGLYLPGTRIPIYSPDRLLKTRPDFILILPWNLKDEIVDQMSFVRDWGAKFVTPIPYVEVFD
jgi:2-polyprenyl-3-methyl-5-hydroxy-6-metoxy-1,4-benzoquinol methylase